MRLTFSIILVIAPYFCLSQTRSEALSVLKKIESEVDVENYQTLFPSWEFRLAKTSTFDFVINEFSDKSDINSKHVGDTLTYRPCSSCGLSAVKVISESIEPIYGVKYIYLNGNEMNLEKINALRTEIIQNYNQGTSFESMISKYTMDGNESGSLEWFRTGMLVKEFETAVLNHKKGDIFTVDVSYNNWYYVVLKTQNDSTSSVFTYVEIENVR